MNGTDSPTRTQMLMLCSAMLCIAGLGCGAPATTPGVALWAEFMSYEEVEAELPFLARNDLVLKPTHAAQGEGVELGWHHSVSSWDEAVRGAVESDYIVQQRVPTHRKPYPGAEPGLPIRELYEDTDPFVARGELGGFLTRLSGEEIVNVARGGSVVPTFVVAAR